MSKPNFDIFCAEHNCRQIKTPQQQPKPTLGMTFNDCVDNAADYTALYTDWQFCAGWFYDEEHHRLLAHAWNRKGKKHRDVTPFRIKSPTTYIWSEHWSERLYHAVLQFRAGDDSLMGVIHPNYKWQGTQWLEDAPYTREQQMASLLKEVA